MAQAEDTIMNSVAAPAAPPAEKPAHEETFELGRVVVSTGTEESAGRPWYVTLRPWLFCLLFLALTELGTRIYFDRTLCLLPERFDNFPNAAAEDVWMDQMRRDPAVKVVVIGDSVIVGASLIKKEETIPQYLERALANAIPGREVHVWNLGIAGGRSSDQLCILQKVLESGAKPDFVVLSANHIMFRDLLKQMPLAYPFLARNLEHVPPSIQPLLASRGYKDVIDDACTNWFEKSFRVIGMRQAINAKLFGVQPRAPIDTPNPAVMSAATLAKQVHAVSMKPWYVRTKSVEQWRGQYDHQILPSNFNAAWYPPMFEALRRAGIPALSYITPQNPFFVSQFLTPAEYEANREQIRTFLRNPQIPTADLSELVPMELFYDNDHMLASGNKIMADALAQRIRPVLQERFAPVRIHTSGTGH